jgi:5-methylcytosine-specific restriction endonuclease McrA
MSQAFKRKAAYHWYLGSAFWREKSQYILERDNHTCQKCLKRRATQVHHLTYVRVFQEDPSDLVSLCQPCHAEIHWRQPANDNQIQFRFDFPTEDENDED